MTSPDPMLPKDLSEEEFQFFRDYIHEHSGIFLEQAKFDSLRISLITRATRFGLDALSGYFKILTTDEGEFRELMNLVTINETSFFRLPAQFDAMRAAVIPEILERKGSDSSVFRVWSAGCSTGEEPYTIGMSLIDSGIEGLGYAPEILGTDVSSSALTRAQRAIYPARAVANLSHDVLTRFFELTAEGYRVRQAVRRLVDFNYHNLIKEPYPLALMGNWDIIFCRNVTIYFRLESTRRVVENFYQSLNPGGYLFIGHSETLTSITDKFEPVEAGGVFLYRKPAPRPMISFSERVEVRKREMARAARTALPRPPVHVRSVFESTPAVSEPAPETRTVPAAPAVEAGGIDELLARAREASAEGRTSDALALATQALEADSSRAEAYLLAAFAHADTGDFDAALDESNRALDIDPLLASARYVLGLIYLRTDRLDEAMFEFKRTIYTDADFVLAHLNLGNLYRARGAVEDAAREYENALAALYRNPEGPWSVFLGGFRPDLLAKTCERSLLECRKAIDAAKGERRRWR